jgi:hypothetical protein
LRDPGRISSLFKINKNLYTNIINDADHN